jgi:putative toxin-antitoxin system antitoxin component (TIGR02293 family)
MSSWSLTSLLGGPKVLGSRPTSASQWHETISRGVPVQSAGVFKKHLHVHDALLAHLLGVSEKTLSRHRKSKSSLGAVASDRLFRAARISALASSVLGSDEVALSWLRRPQFGLGGLVPIEMLTTSAGAQEVERLLLRIEHGVYT